MTVYREMDIATAKPTASERAEVPYFLLDLVAPSELFTVADFQRAARDAARAEWDRGRRVMYVGGTGLYGRAVIDDLDIPGEYPEVRRVLEVRATTELATLYEELHHLDPVAARRMEPTNERRIVRALEVTIGSGRAFSSFGEGLTSYPPRRIVQIGLRRAPETLDQRISARFHQWMDEGLLDEVRRLAAHPGGVSRTARQAVGYKELLAHVEAGEPLDRCVEAAITHSRQLARRQRRWFERDPRIEWFEDDASARARIEEILDGPDGLVRDYEHESA